MGSTLYRPAQCLCFRLAFPCDLREVRPAVRAVKQFLAEQGVQEEDVTACELALTEACNNAVQYAPETRQQDPVEVEITCSGSWIELRVLDHTAGFSLQTECALPKPNDERGRGLFLIQSVMDRTQYLRAEDENALVMRKNRNYQEHSPSNGHPTTLEEAKRRLSECERVSSEMAKELCFRSESLLAIFRASAELGQTNNLDGFAQRLLNDLLHITAADWFLLRLVSREKNTLQVRLSSLPSEQYSPGPLDLASADGSPAVELAAARSGDDLTFRQSCKLAENDPLRALPGNAVGFVHPFFSGDRLIGTLTLGKNAHQTPFSPVQTEMAHTFAEFLAIQMVNAQFQEEQVHHRLVSHELEIARTIQRALLPRSLPHVPGGGLAGYCESARQVGGDFYDVIPVSDHALLLVIADVMGKGVPAAIFAATLRGLVRAIPEWAHQPSELLGRMNRLLFDELSEVDMFITAQLVYLDLDQRRLITANAGHCPALVNSPDRPEVRLLAPEGMPLGILPSTTFSNETVPLSDRFRLLLHTDGVTEARNTAGESFGQDQLCAWFEGTASRVRAADELKNELISTIETFQGPSALQDDQTFLLFIEQGESASAGQAETQE